MRKFISAVTSLAMTATMATAFVPATTMAAAEDASKGLSLEAFAEADSKYSAMGSNITVSAADIAAGDVTIPCALYFDEVNHSQTIAATWSVNGGADAANITFKAYDPGANYWPTAKTYTLADGTSFSTQKYVAFAGKYDDFEENYMNHGMYNITCVKGMKFANIDNYYMCVGWTNGGYDYAYTGEKSDSHPVAVFDVTLPKGTSAGTYTLDFTSFNTSGNPDQVNPATMIETKGRYTEALGNLDLTSLSIKVEGETSEPQPTTTTTTKKVTTTTTTTTSVTPDPEAGEIIFDFGNYDAKPGDKVKVNVTITPNGQPIAAIDAVLKYDSPLTLTNIGSESKAFGKPIVSNLPENAWSVITLGGDKNDTPMVAEDGSTVVTLGFQVPADCPDGKYEIGFGDKCMVFKDSTNFTYKVTKLNGFITVGDVTPDPTTTTTSKTTTTTTTTTTTPAPQPGDGEYAPVWGDTNCDGKVNVSDVVILNKWLHDSASIQISDQGKVNADCCDPQDANGGKVKVSGVKLTAADSDAIIKSIVHLVTLPVSSN